MLFYGRGGILKFSPVGERRTARRQIYSFLERYFVSISRTTIWRVNQLRYIHRNVPEGIRTPDPRLRRPLLYPAELQIQKQRVMGIEPTCPAWKAGVLPLNYTRICIYVTVKLFSRGDRIRTCDPLLPKQVL